MTTEVRPSAFSKAEAGSRQLVLQLGLGVVAFVLGSIFAGGASARLFERISPRSDVALWVFQVGFERLWLFTTAPLFAWAIGRFTQLDLKKFALWSGLSGETFAVLLVSGIHGFEYLVAEPINLVARVVTLFLGLFVIHRAALNGRETAAEVQREADAIAEARKAEYAQYLAAAEGKPSLSPEGGEGRGEGTTEGR
jgi:hypothetical protein